MKPRLESKLGLPLRYVALGLLLGAGACHRHHGKVVRVHPPVAVEEALGAGSIERDPNQRGPGPNEERILEAYDLALEQLTFDSGLNLTYDDLLQVVRLRAGMSGRIEMEVAQDFRLSPVLGDVAGALPGHEYILFDGKLLDILLEYASFLALSELGWVDRDPVWAVDEIVFLHNEILGPTTEGFLYPYWLLDEQTAALADEYLLRLVEPLVHHQFGHVFLFHALDALRDGADLDFLIDYLPVEEDDADLLAGMLSAKVGCDPLLSVELFDILAFSLVQRFDPPFTYDWILTETYQHALLSDDFSPLAVRKDSFLDGFDRYLSFWF